MVALAAEDQGDGQDLVKRQSLMCDNSVPISTRYEASTITTVSVSYSPYTRPQLSTFHVPQTLRPEVTRINYTFREPLPRTSTRPSTSTTWLPPKKSVVSTTTDIIPKARAVQGAPVTITRTIITRVPVETIWSCPPNTSREPPTSRVDRPTSRSSRAPSTFREPPPTSREPRTSREPPTTSSHERPTSITQPSSTRHRPTTSSEEPWHPSSSSTPNTPTSRTRPTQPPSTSLPPSTRPTSSVPPRTSSAPNSTTTHTPWPPTTTSAPYSECVYTLFDGTVPYGNYTASCTGSTTSEALCSSLHSGGEWWILVPCTSTHANTSSTASTLANTTTSTRTITSWPCSSFASSWDRWVGVPCTSSINVTSSTWPCSSYATSLERWVSAPCTSTTPNITSSSIERCSSFMGSRSGWAVVPCTSMPPTITTTPTVTTTPTLTHSRSCSTYVEDLETWLPMPCDTVTTVPTIITIPSITITPNITETHNTTTPHTITETFVTEPTITASPTLSHSQHCSAYVSELELWVSTPCVTASPTPSMCLDDDEDMWAPCTLVTRTPDTDTSSQTIIYPIFVTATPTLQTSATHTRSINTDIDESTMTVEEETETHTPTPTLTHRPPSALSMSTSEDFVPSSEELGSSTWLEEPASTREHTTTRETPSTHEVRPTSTREVATIVVSTHFDPPQTRPTSTRLTQVPSPQQIPTSNFLIPTGAVSIPLPSSTATITPPAGGIQGGALAGIVVGTILGVVGLLGLGAFIMKSLSGPRGHDLFGPRGGYQATSGSGSIGGRDDGGGGGRGSGEMSETRNESPLRSALRNRNMADGGGGWGDASWNPAYAYTGVAAVAAAAATTANNQRGRDANTGRYANGGIRDDDTPDAVPERYADGGLSGPDSQYDTGTSNHPYGSQDLHRLVSSSEVQFDPYHDLPARQDSVPAGGNITRQSAFTTPEVSLSPPGGTSPYHPTSGNIATAYPGPVSSFHPQTDTGVFLSATGGLSTTSFAASSIDQPVQPPVPGNTYQSSPPYAYAGNSGIGGMMHQSPEPLAQPDIQRPPYWEGSIAAASVDSLPQHGNIPRYSAFTDAGNTLGMGGSPPQGLNNTPGIGVATTSTPGMGGTIGVGGVPQSTGVVGPTWNPVGVTELGQNIMGFSAQVDVANYMPSSAAPDAPRNLHQGLTRLSTELASAEGRDLDASSPRSASRASARPPRVGGPRIRPPRTPSSVSRPDSRRSLPPAYEERQSDS